MTIKRKFEILSNLIHFLDDLDGAWGISHPNFDRVKNLIAEVEELTHAVYEERIFDRVKNLNGG